MYNIPVYKQKLYAVIKERYNLKSNAQAGQKIHFLKKYLKDFTFWQKNPLERYEHFDDILNDFEPFRIYTGYKRYNFFKLFVFKYDNYIPFFANDDIKLLYHIYNADFILP